MFRKNPITGAMALALLAIPAMAAAPQTGAPAWTVDHSRSSIGFSAVHSGQAFSGTFGKWDAAILFDPDQLTRSSADVTIDMNTPKTGDPSRDTTLPEGDWFNTFLFPTASFKAETIRAGDAPDSYIADGTLTIRDVSQPVSLPFTLAIDGDEARMQGTLTIDRGTFGVGQGVWAGDGAVSLAVKVDVEVTATRAN